jgi:translocator protein
VTPAPRPRRVALVFALCLVLPLAAGAISGLATDPRFYLELERPSWAPPGWLFGPVWTVLYVLMGLASFWVWRVRGWSGARGALGLYGAQLALNAAWSPIFFGLRALGPALVELVLLWVAVVATIIAFARHARGAALLLVPYLGWVTFAGALNLALWRMNG